MDSVVAGGDQDVLDDVAQAGNGFVQLWTGVVVWPEAPSVAQLTVDEEDRGRQTHGGHGQVEHPPEEGMGTWNYVVRCVDYTGWKMSRGT